MKPEHLELKNDLLAAIGKSNNGVVIPNANPNKADD